MLVTLKNLSGNFSTIQNVLEGVRKKINTLKLGPGRFRKQRVILTSKLCKNY